MKRVVKLRIIGLTSLFLILLYSNSSKDDREAELTKTLTQPDDELEENLTTNKQEEDNLKTEQSVEANSATDQREVEDSQTEQNEMEILTEEYEEKNSRTQQNEEENIKIVEHKEEELRIEQLEEKHWSNDQRQEGRTKQRSGRKNVLFLMTDDMRAQLGGYEGAGYSFKSPRMSTPQLDQLAERSLVIRNAFVQYALCGPSRASILTGRRPDATGVFDNHSYWRDVGGDFTTIPQYFKQNGYFTVGVGKIFHKKQASANNDPQSWSEMTPPVEIPVSPDREPGHWGAVSEEENRKYPLEDQALVNVTKGILRRLAPLAKSGQQPFFVAHGFKRPHAPYVCPDEYFNKYQLEIPGEYLSQNESQKCSVSGGTLRTYRRAYYACISFVDSLVGELLNTLEQLGLKNNTIVSFVSDHGYNFGEHGMFGKSDMYDSVTRVPLMIHIPNRTDGGIKSDAVAETVDLFASLAEASGLPPIPQCPRNSSTTRLCTDGNSLLPLIDNPGAQLKSAAFSQRRQGANGMRYSIRTRLHRLTKTIILELDDSGTVQSWRDSPTVKPGKIWELFHNEHDPRELINRNDTNSYHEIKQQLNRDLERFIGHALLKK